MTLPLPPLNLHGGTTQATASAPMQWDSSGMTVNYGTGNSGAGAGSSYLGVPWYLWALGAGLLAWRMKTRR